MKKDTTFYAVLADVQRYISQKYANLLERPNNREQLKNYVIHYLKTEKISLESMTQDELVNRLLLDMTEYSFLSIYLADDTVEEINVNAWNDVKILHTNGRVSTAPECFRDAQHAIDIIKRMLQRSNMTWDNSKPKQVGHLPGNIRITVAGFDVVDSSKALAVSIRKITAAAIDEQDYIAGGSATASMLDMLSMMYNHGVSICIAGATGSGKTTLLSWVLHNVPDNRRIITIEQGTREFDCTRIDEEGKVVNNVVHLSARQSEDVRQEVSQEKLLELIMTMNPDCIAVGEAKGEEAMQAVNAANTGHAVITTTHANSCADIYDRLISLCKLKYPNMDEGFLRKLVIKAFPVTVFLCHLDADRHVIMAIEETRYESGKEKVTRLKEYEIESVTQKAGETETKGRFVDIEAPSNEIRTLMRQNGLTDTEAERIWGNAR